MWGRPSRLWKAGVGPISGPVEQPPDLMWSPAAKSYQMGQILPFWLYQLTFNSQEGGTRILAPQGYPTQILSPNVVLWLHQQLNRPKSKFQLPPGAFALFQLVVVQGVWGLTRHQNLVPADQMSNLQTDSGSQVQEATKSETV